MSTIESLETLAFDDGWSALESGAALEAMSSRILPSFLAGRRWFGAKGSGIGRILPAGSATLPDDDLGHRFTFWSVETPGGAVQKYLLPLAVAWETGEERGFPPAIMAAALARVRHHGRIGLLHDALEGQSFPVALAGAVLEGREIHADAGARLVFTPARAPAPAPREPECLVEAPVRPMGREQTNSSLLIGGTLVLKVYRRLVEGIHPEVEVGRFLTDAARFANVPPLRGSVERVAADGTSTALAILQEFVPNQGDGWSFALDHVNRFLDRGAGHEAFLAAIKTLGRRVAELHLAFALPNDDPAFASEPVSATDLAAWSEAVGEQAKTAERALRRSRSRLASETALAVDGLLADWNRIDAFVAEALPSRPEGWKTRHHGDLHLGQVVVAGEDFFLLDFEGEPEKPLNARRAKHSSLRDVAGMVRSFDYAAWAAWFERAGPEGRTDAREDERASARIWVAEATRAFLAGYFQAMGDHPSLPRDGGMRERLLDLFILEKALYEIGYESANRPDWLPIPLQGTRLLLGLIS